MPILWEDEQPCRRFSLDEIKTATANFDEKLIIGKGGFGLVYIGSINNGTEVAIKRLSLGSTQGETEFLREIETLSKLQHHHLVRLKGYCNESPEMILVYDYMPNGTLVDHLYKTKDLGSSSADGDHNQQYYLTWEQRLSICIGAARGLDYLHREHVPGIIHRDIKDSNILLDDNFVAKIADFGLAKLVRTSTEAQTTIVSSTGVKGTFGYLDPEYFYTQRLSKKTDVYAFGVLLLVVLCGRPAVDSKAPEDQRSLPEWAKKCIEKNKVDLIIDPHLAGKISSMSLKQFVKVSQKCLRRQSEQRPTMEEVLSGLELALKKQPTPGSSSKQSDGRSSLTQMVAKLQIVLTKRQSALVSQTTNNTTNSSSSNIHKNSLFSITTGASGGASPNGRNILQSGPRVFSYTELKAATKNFRSDTMLGEGGFGKVFKGWLDEKGSSKSGSGSVIAVKKLNRESVEGFEEWQSEVNFLGNLSHSNFVKLFGYCREDKELLLVYEFMQKGSLESHLFRRDSTAHPIPWEIRLKILIGAARGLGFLHSLERPVIHRDFKASNILLDGSYNAKISDFGFAKLGPTESRSHVSTRVIGTYGYAAPEYVATGHLYVKRHVYAFGVVMLEMLTGLRALDANRSSGELILVDWIKPHLSGRRRLKRIMDARLEDKYPSKSAFQIAQLASTCLEYEPRMRPSMKDVLETLEQNQSANEKARE